MTLIRLRHRFGIAATAALFGWSTLAAAPSPAHAETVDGRGKGIAGGIMLGAEVVMSVEALFGVKPAWAYILGGGLGAVGGGLAGFGVESAAKCYDTTGAFNNGSAGDGRAPVTMLALGLAFVIPTIVLIANATRFKPSEDAVEDKAPRNSPPADPGKIGGSVVVGGEGGGTGPLAPTAPAAPAGGAGGGGAGGGTGPAPTPQQAPPPTSLMDIHTGTLRLGLPAPEVRAAYTPQQQRDLGVQQITEVRFPVLHVAF
jgi:hypothetical protein